MITMSEYGHFLRGMIEAKLDGVKGLTGVRVKVEDCKDAISLDVGFRGDREVLVIGLRCLVDHQPESPENKVRRFCANLLQRAAQMDAEPQSQQAHPVANAIAALRPSLARVGG
jgi:hypothetical protein